MLRSDFESEPIEILFSPQLFYPLGEKKNLYVEQLDVKLMMYFSPKLEQRSKRVGELHRIMR